MKAEQEEKDRLRKEQEENAKFEQEQLFAKKRTNTTLTNLKDIVIKTASTNLSKSEIELKTKEAKDKFESETNWIPSSIDTNSTIRGLDMASHTSGEGCKGMLYLHQCWGVFNAFVPLLDSTVLKFDCIGTYDTNKNRCEG